MASTFIFISPNEDYICIRREIYFISKHGYDCNRHHLSAIPYEASISFIKQDIYVRRRAIYSLTALDNATK